jgi:hypothetical protein
MRHNSKVIVVLLFLISMRAVVFAQAWTPTRGEGYVSLTFTDTFTKDHFLSSGARRDIGHIRSVTLVPEVDFGLTDRLAADFALPVVAAKYYGPDPHQLPYDNGNYHGGTQDFSIGVRYNWLRRPLTVTPFIRLGVPSRGYTYFAHSAVGTGQRESALGIAVGHQSETWLPNAYFQAAFSYGIVQKVIGIRPNRSHMLLEGGYAVSRRLTLRALAESQITNGGLNIPQDYPVIADYPQPPNLRWSHHDQISNVNSLSLGGGFDVALTGDWDVYGTAFNTVWGQNGHAVRGLAIGMSWKFRTPWARVSHLQQTSPETR